LYERAVLSISDFQRLQNVLRELATASSTERLLMSSSANNGIEIVK
jgi:hypothetical protein